MNCILDGQQETKISLGLVKYIVAYMQGNYEIGLKVHDHRCYFPCLSYGESRKAKLQIKDTSLESVLRPLLHVVYMKYSASYYYSLSLIHIQMCIRDRYKSHTLLTQLQKTPTTIWIPAPIPFLHTPPPLHLSLIHIYVYKRQD